MMASKVNAAALNYNLQSGGKSELGKEDFLKLMVLQLQNQDPLDPLSNEEYIAQLAQFNALEQMQNLNNTMSQVGGVQTMANTAALIGKTVSFLESGSTLSGVVKQAIFADGSASLIVSDGTTNHFVTLDKILAIKE